MVRMARSSAVASRRSQSGGTAFSFAPEVFAAARALELVDVPDLAVGGVGFGRARLERVEHQLVPAAFRESC